MDLAINIGNYNLQISFREDEILTTYRIPTATPELENALIDLILAHENSGEIKNVIIASVNLDLNDLVQTAVMSALDLTPRFISHDDNFSIDYSLYEGSALGMDRIICCEAALDLTPAPFIMIDMGTATTVNFVSENRVFLGGMILPGVEMGLRALSKDTNLLPKIELSADMDLPLFGTTTQQSIASGAINGFSLQIDSIISKMWEVQNTKGNVIISGGSAKFIAPKLSLPFLYIPDLASLGFFSVLDKNLLK